MIEVTEKPIFPGLVVAKVREGSAVARFKQIMPTHKTETYQDGSIGVEGEQLSLPAGNILCQRYQGLAAGIIRQ